jgi:uncharacterized protein
MTGRARCGPLVVLLGVVVLAATPARGRDGLLPLSAFPRETVAVETRSARRHVFEAWRADTPRARVQGLMFVESLAPEQAMIFVYDPPQVAGMWMMNTLIPLDMLFVDAAGCVVKVHEQARPGSFETIAAEVPVALVVELAGGTAATLGLRVGDRVTRPEVAWPREPRPCTARR